MSWGRQTGKKKTFSVCPLPVSVNTSGQPLACLAHAPVGLWPVFLKERIMQTKWNKRGHAGFLKGVVPGSLHLLQHLCCHRCSLQQSNCCGVLEEMTATVGEEKGRIINGVCCVKVAKGRVGQGCLAALGQLPASTPRPWPHTQRPQRTGCCLTQPSGATSPQRLRDAAGTAVQRASPARQQSRRGALVLPRAGGRASHLPGAAHRPGVLHRRGQALAEGVLPPRHGRQPHLALLRVP